MSSEEKAKRNLAAAKGQLIRAQYEALKAKVFTFERDNYDKLVLFRSSPKYFKMGGNSALMFYYIYAKQIEWQCRLLPDRDFAYKFPNGIISFQKVDKLEQQLAKIGIKVFKKEENFISLKLPEKITPTKIKALRDAESVRRKQINTLVLPNGPTSPELYAKLRLVMDRVNSLYRSANRVDRAFFYEHLMTSARASLQIYFKVAQGRVKPESYAVMVEHISNLLIDLELITDLKLEEPKRIAAISAVAADTLAMAKKVLNG